MSIQVPPQLNDLADEICKDAVAKGFWAEGLSDYVLGTKVSLIHSEVSEMLEALRENELLPDKHLPHRLNAEIECADAIIRLLDFAAALDWDIATAIQEKLEYNRSRPHKHGNKRF